MLDLLAYPFVGVVAGVLAGLLGVGGGIVVVPALVYLFASSGILPGHVMQMSLGTSLGVICFTSISSSYSHHRRGAVRWPIVVSIAPGILLGTFGGAHLAAALSTMFLKAFFALFLLMVCAQMLLDLRPEASRALPGRAGVILVGGVIGLVSALVGIGGGTLSVPFMSYCNVAMRQAIGTSAAIGFPIAAAGTLGYVTSGIGAEGLPSLSLGYVYLPALAGVALGSVLTAPLGASLAHSIPVKTLKRCFGAFLLIVAARMLWDVFTRAS